MYNSRLLRVITGDPLKDIDVLSYPLSHFSLVPVTTSVHTIRVASIYLHHDIFFVHLHLVVKVWRGGGRGK